MSDPTTPVLDPVEDRLRRTFAVRAEDMALGDADGLPPDLLLPAPFPAPQRSRWTRRPLQAAAVVVLVTLVAAGVALVAREGGDGEADRTATVGDPPSGVSPAEVAIAPRALVAAMQDERNLATIWLIGFEEALVLPVSDTAQARSATDAAVAAFEAFVAASPERAAYAQALGSLDGLGLLRSDIDADPGPRTLDNLPASQDVFARYTELVDAVLRDQVAFAESIDDPGVRAGAEAYARGVQLFEQIAQLAYVSVPAVVVPDADVVGELSRLRTEVQQGLDSLVADTAGTPYEEAATTFVGEIEDSGLLDAIGAALAGEADIGAILSALDAGPSLSTTYLDRVEEILAEES